MSVEEFAKKVEATIFPDALNALKDCNSQESLQLWRKTLFQNLKLSEEDKEDEDNRNSLDPEEKWEKKPKVELMMSQRVYLEARKLENLRISTDSDLKVHKVQI